MCGANNQMGLLLTGDASLHAQISTTSTNMFSTFAPPKKTQHQPHQNVQQNYWQKQQFIEPEYSTPCLNKKQTKFIQEVTGTFLFHARAVDGTMLTALSALASKQAIPTEKTFMKVKRFLHYATNPDTIITYQASNMVLGVHSNASYLSEFKAWSRAGGHFFMRTNTTFLPNNAAVHNTIQILKHIMSSAMEAELGMLFINSNLQPNYITP